MNVGIPILTRGCLRAALASATLGVLLALALAGHASAATTTLNVNPTTGKDTNPGTIAAPLKTLGKALTLAHAGDTVKLATGSYGSGSGSGNGETFPAGGLVVPSGVTISGTTSSGFPTSTLIGTGNGVALSLAGDATVRNLIFGGNGFGVGLYAKQGNQTLSNLLLATTNGSAIVDGSQTSAGILLLGTAQANLDAGASGANTTGTTLFVNARTGAAVRQQARLVVHGGQIRLGDDTTGVFVADEGRLVIDGATVTGGAANCGLDSAGVALHDAAQATFKNGARLQNIPGFGILMDGTAKTLLSAGAAVTREATAGCKGRPSIDARGAATLTTNGATIASTGGQDVDGIVTEDTVTLALTNTDVHGFTGNGIDLNTNEKLTIAGGSVNSNAIGIEARTLADNTATKKTPHIKITGATVAANQIGIQVDEPIFKLRHSSVVSNQTGIDVIGEVGGLPVGDTCAFACVNLGFGDDPGNNNLAGNTVTGVEVRHSIGSAGNLSGVTAVGNFWNANTQGANGDGHYVAPLIVNAGDPLAAGHNFELSGINTLIQLAAPAIGRLRLAPHVLRARVGKVA